MGAGWQTGQQAKAARAAGKPAPEAARGGCTVHSGPSGRRTASAAARAQHFAGGYRRADAHDRQRATVEHGERAAAQLAPPERPSEL